MERMQINTVIVVNIMNTSADCEMLQKRRWLFEENAVFKKIFLQNLTEKQMPSASKIKSARKKLHHKLLHKLEQESTILFLPPPPQPIINELLCFVQNRIQRLPFDSLVQLCSDLYSCEVISTAKHLLYNNVVTKGRLVSRKGANKAKMNMSDIVKVFLEMEIYNAPIFVARNLAELPPLTVDSLDSLKLITELETVAQEMQLFFGRTINEQ